MNTYTGFCIHKDGKGTTWINTVQASSIEAAQDTARDECAADWECSADDVQCIGIAAGNVDILFWED